MTLLKISLNQSPDIIVFMELTSKFLKFNKSFFQKDNLYRIGEKTYIPTHSDVLMSRKKSVGINDFKYFEKDVIINVIDVGGQRSERKKWAHVMKNVDILLYVVSLSDYQEALLEDETNSMIESLEIFQQTINGEWFKESKVMLFFNKDEYFKTLISEQDNLVKVFKDYKGGKNYEEGKKFIIEKYTKLLEKKDCCNVVVGNAINDETIFEITDTFLKLIPKKEEKLENVKKEEVLE